MTANAWWTSFSNYAILFFSRYMCLLVVNLTADARPVFFLLSICNKRVRDLVLLDSGSLARCVLDLVF